MSSQALSEPLIIGRYQLHGEIAHGGMATVHYGRLLGAAGFSRTVAIKRLHPQFANEPEFVAMFTDEARLAARIRHPNVVTTLDVVQLESELLIVMEYVQGESLSRLLRAASQRKVKIPPGIVSNILSGALEGLHAAHEARNERDEPLELVHRDVSPQNVLVGADGIPRVLDFGVAKASGRLQTTRDGQLKGKISYMAPEQLMGTTVDRRTDVYAVGVLLWEALAGRRLFQGDEDVAVFGKVLNAKVPKPSSFVPSVTPALDAVVMKGLNRDPALRFQTAHDMAIALEDAAAPAPIREVAKWVQNLAEAALRKRATSIAEIESVSEVRESLLAARDVIGSAPVVLDDPDPEGNAPTVISDTSQVSGALAGQSSSSVSGLSQPSLATASQTMTSLGTLRSEGQGRKSATALIVTAALLAVALGVALTLLVVRQTPASEDTPSAEQTEPPATETEAVAAPPIDTAALPVALEQVEELPSEPDAADSEPEATPPPSVAKPKSGSWRPRKPGPAPAPKPASVAAPAAPKPAPSPAAPAPQPDCNPPYTIDKDGVRIPKPQCF